MLISLVAVFGVVLGAYSVWWVVTKKHKSDVALDRQFLIMLVSDSHVYISPHVCSTNTFSDNQLSTHQTIIIALIFTTVLQMTFQVVNRPHLWLDDCRLWTHILVIASLVVIFSVQYLERTRLQSTCSVVVFYWFFVFLAFATKLRSLILRRIYEENLPYFITFCLSFGLVCIEFALVWLAPKRIAYDVLGDNDNMNESPSERASIFSILTFSWMTPMMKYGYKNYVTENDLWNLPKQDTAGAASDRFQNAWNFQLEHKKNPSLWMALFRGFGAAYVQGALFKTGADVFSFLQPQLLRLLMSFVDSYQGQEPQPATRGAAIALGMFVVSIAQSLCLHQCFQWISQTGIRLKSSLISAVYMKSLRLSNGVRATQSTGNIVNLMAVDCQRVQDASQFGQHLWSAPLQIILCLASLYQLLGYSMFAGVTIMVITIPSNGLITTVLKNLQKQQMKNKDARSRLIAEVLSNMKSIKLFAWGQAFMNRIGHIRNDQELATLRKIGIVQAISSFTGSVSPFLVICSTFVVYVLAQKKPLTPEIVFPALTLFHLLASPLAVLPAAISAGAEATIAVGRLRAFFTADELQPDAVIHEEAATDMGQESVNLRDATFTWDRYESKSALEDINFSAHVGQLCCLVGRVGAGKSSFIQAVLGDLYKVHGTVTIHGSIAYVAQQPWVLNASVQDNITFGHRWDPEFYEETVKACALLEDFLQLPNGDQTEVGDRGIILSGGQKARLTLARAVYSRADIYLLDDCLAAVDQHVGRHLIDNVLGPRGLLRRKTRILATNSIPAMIEADNLVLIRDGKIRETGTYKQLNGVNGEFANLISKASNSNQSDSENKPYSDGTTIANRSDIPVQNKLTSHRTSVASLGPPKKRPDVEVAASRTKPQKEPPRQGGVNWSVYGSYAKASNLPALAVYVATLLCAQTTELGKLQFCSRTRHFWISRSRNSIIHSTC
jgi:ABC-type multidrug transport system fused ATPase/permease subunit